MAVRLEIIDTSAWARRNDPRIRLWFEQATREGALAICDLVMLELLRYVPARSYEEVERNLEGFPPILMVNHDWHTARVTQRELARQTAQDHRKVKLADLLIAAAAARTGLPVVHYDDDFERIQRVTEQPMRWVAPRGTLGT